MPKRDFRTAESFAAEHITRGLIKSFLQSKGFIDVVDERKRIGKGDSQTMHATAPDGETASMRVKLCWRPREKRTSQHVRWAAQLLAKVKGSDWEAELHAFVERARGDGLTHFLFVQRQDQTIISAALVPLSELVAIWCSQRDISKSLIAQHRLGRRKKNHAMNGSSPTLWLEDDMAPEVVNALWAHEGVVDLTRIKTVAPQAPHRPDSPDSDDTFDDLPGIDYSLIGSDGATPMLALKSNTKRDRRVREAVLSRAANRCERKGCGAIRDYPGFLDVHHILGAGTSDRVWNCVALCPNCHREAHAAPDREQLNARLLEYAQRFEKAVKHATSAG